jgi:hypothetical protein
MERQELRQAVGRGALFAGILAFLSSLPFLVLTLHIPFGTLFLFILPQYIVPTNTYLPRPGAVQVWPWTWVLGWAIVAVAFGWFARRLRISGTAGVAVLIVVLVTVLIHVAVGAAGWSFELDGP